MSTHRMPTRFAPTTSPEVLARATMVPAIDPGRVVVMTHDDLTQAIFATRVLLNNAFATRSSGVQDLLDTLDTLVAERRQMEGGR